MGRTSMPHRIIVSTLKEVADAHNAAAYPEYRIGNGWIDLFVTTGNFRIAIEAELSPDRIRVVFTKRLRVSWRGAAHRLGSS